MNLNKPRFLLRSLSFSKRTGRAEKKPHEVLLEAAGVIVERGHAKRTLQDARGAVCLSGALQVALTGSANGGGTCLTARLEDVEGVVGCGEAGSDYRAQEVIWWNNVDERGKAEVIAALDAAAVVAMQEASLEPEDVLR